MVMRNNTMQIRYKGLIREKLKSGNIKWRVRVEGNKAKRISIPVGPEDKDFRKYYDAARVGMQPNETEAFEPKATRNTVKWLCQRYIEHLENMVDVGQASPLTLKQRRGLAAELLKQKSEATNSQGQAFAGLHMEMPAAELVKMRDRMMHKPGATANMFKFLRTMYDWACERGYCSINPAKGIKVAYTSSGGAVPWSVSDLEKFRQVHPFGTKAHLCLSIFMFTACRIGDAYKLGRQHETTVDGLPWLRWQPSKRGSRPVQIPILPPLLRALRSQPVIGQTYLMTEYGNPFSSSEGLRNRFSKWCIEAGLENRSSHGIRKAAGNLLALHGATQYEITAVHGHANASTSEIYTRDYDRQAVAQMAMSRLKDLSW